MISKYETRASRWRAFAYPRASAIAYLRAHQNSKCVPPVLIHRAITCDSFKVLAQKVYGKLCDNKTKQGPKNLLFYLWWPPDMPRGKFLHHWILLFITFDLICNMTIFIHKWILDPSGPRPRPHSPVPGVTSISECVPLVLIHRAIAYESFEILG